MQCIGEKAYEEKIYADFGKFIILIVFIVGCLNSLIICIHLALSLQSSSAALQLEAMECNYREKAINLLAPQRSGFAELYNYVSPLHITMLKMAKSVFKSLHHFILVHS